MNPRLDTRRHVIMEGQSRTGLRQGVLKTRSAACGRNQKLSSRRDAENAKKKGTPCSHPLRSWRLGAIQSSLSPNDSRSSSPRFVQENKTLTGSNAGQTREWGIGCFSCCLVRCGALSPRLQPKENPMSGVQEIHVLNKGDHGVRSPVDGLEGKP